MAVLPTVGESAGRPRTGPRAAEPPECQVRNPRYVGEVALRAGNERAGMSHAFRALCDELVTIPLPGSADSLNLSAAVSIVLYEILRDRLTPKPE